MKYLMTLSLFLCSVGVAEHAELADAIKDAELKHNIPEGLLHAIITVESKGNHKAFVKEDGSSKRASYGLLQLQLASAQLVGFKGKAKELMDPRVNIKYGAAYLAWLLNKSSHDTARALTGWNAGPNSELYRNKRYSSYSGLVLNAYIKENK